jgi:hypothetical protein
MHSFKMYSVNDECKRQLMLVWQTDKVTNRMELLMSFNDKVN